MHEHFVSFLSIFYFFPDFLLLFTGNMFSFLLFSILLIFFSFFSFLFYSFMFYYILFYFILFFFFYIIFSSYLLFFPPINLSFPHCLQSLRACCPLLAPPPSSQHHQQARRARLHMGRTHVVISSLFAF